MADTLAYREGDSTVALGAVTFPARLLEGTGKSLDELLAALPVDHAEVASLLFTLPKAGWRPVLRRGSAADDDLDLVIAAPHDTQVGKWSLLRLHRSGRSRFELTATAGPLTPEHSEPHL